MSDRKYVLVVDHDGDVAAVIGETLETLDYAVSLARHGEEMQAIIGRGFART